MTRIVLRGSRGLVSGDMSTSIVATNRYNYGYQTCNPNYLVSPLILYPESPIPLNSGIKLKS